ncbi:MAG: DUF493 family protein [Endozoicomonadaceae bacterium]|nr:DUF493 family protein [Endozoicomonadaceae bacterium]
MPSQKKPIITFPCKQYPIRILGTLQTAQQQNTIIAIIKKYDPDNTGALATKQSRKGTFQSMLFSIYATSEIQLKKLHHDLKATGLVKIVL